jgi:hypothetical protein
MALTKISLQRRRLENPEGVRVWNTRIYGQRIRAYLEPWLCLTPVTSHARNFIPEMIAREQMLSTPKAPLPQILEANLIARSL